MLGILGGGFFTYKYVTSEQFKAKMMNEVLRNVKGLMPDVLGNSLPSTTGKSIPTLQKLQIKKWMIFGFLKKLVKYYIDKFINWLRMKRFNLELDNDIKKYHEEMDKKIKKPVIKEIGKFGEDGWSISIGDIEDGDT